MKCKLSYVSEIISGATPSTTHDEYYDGDVVWFTPKDLSDQNTKYVERGSRNITAEGFRSCSARMIPPYNLLMSSRAPIGLLSINEVECCTNQGFKSMVVDKTKADVDYLYYYIKHHLPEVEALGSGTTFKEVSRASLEKWEIDIPDLHTQKEISSILSFLDRKISLNRKANEVLEKMAKQLYDYWFVQFDFPDENGNPYKSSGGKMVYNETLKREIPEGWSYDSIDNFCEVIDCLHSKKPEMVFEDENSYMLTLENLTSDGNISIQNKYYISKTDYQIWTSRIEVRENDFVVTNAGRAGDICKIPYYVKCAIGRNITAIRPKHISPYYLKYFLKSIYVQQQIANNLDCGSFFMSFNVRSIKVMNILKPASNIHNKVHEIIKPMVVEIERNNEEIASLTSLRDFLLPMLMNGQVTIKD